MKRYFIYILLLTIGFFSDFVFAQQSDTVPKRSETNSAQPTPQTIVIEDNCKSIMSIKKEYVKKYLQLTEQEAKAFWPIYNEFLKQESITYDKYRYELERRKIKTQNGRVNPHISSDEEILSYLDLYYQTREATTMLEQKLYLDLKKVLSPRKLLYFLDLEKSFKSRVKDKAKGACPRNK
ncbi:MAG TPA: hypothetical protein PLI77_03655 [Bacteroidales bacterium]|nr:hypothetical protein [Bacteroidales bacterium]